MLMLQKKAVNPSLTVTYRESECVEFNAPPDTI